MYTCMYVCVCVCMYVHIYIYIYYIHSMMDKCTNTLLQLHVFDVVLLHVGLAAFLTKGITSKFYWRAAFCSA